MKSLFWTTLALLYLVLAIASFIVSNKHSGETKLKHSVIKIESEPFMKATYDYLNTNTWINVVGFILASLAAIISS